MINSEGGLYLEGSHEHRLWKLKSNKKQTHENGRL